MTRRLFVFEFWALVVLINIVQIGIIVVFPFWVASMIWPPSDSNSTGYDGWRQSYYVLGTYFMMAEIGVVVFVINQIHKSGKLGKFVDRLGDYMPESMMNQKD